MASSCSHFAAALALVVGGCGCCLLAPAAGGGQKIEFSAPAIPLGVPQQEREIKDDQNRAGTASLGPGSPAGGYLEGGFQPTLIIQPSKPKVKRGWETSPGDDGQREEGGRLNMLPGQEGRLGMTNGADLQKGLNSSATSSLVRSRDDSENGQANGAGLGLLDREINRRDDRIGQGLSDTGGAWGWMRGGFHDHSPMSLERFQDSEFGRAFEPSAMGGRMPPPVSLTDPQQNAGLPPGFGESLIPDDSPRGEAGTFSSPAGLRAWETRTAARQASERAAGWDQPVITGQGMAPPPSVLPFPKRPGSLFQ